MNYVGRLIHRYKILSKPIKASIWFTLCNILQRGFQFISMPIYTRIMSQNDYGIYSIFISWFNLISIFTSLNIYNGVFNKAMVKYENKRAEYISSIQSLTTFLTLFFGITFLVFHDVISYYSGFDTYIIRLLFVHLLLFPTLQYWSQEQRFRYSYLPMIFVTLTNSFFTLVFGVVMVYTSMAKGRALITATVFVQAIVCLFIYISIVCKGKCVYKREYWVWSIKLAIPLIPHYLSEILLGHSDRIMVNYMCGSASAGIYNLVYQISMIMTIIRTGINGAFVPWLYYAIKNKNLVKIRKSIELLSIFMLLMSLLFMLIGPEILKIAAPTSYYEAVVDIPAVMAGGYYIFVYVLFTHIEIYYEEKKYVAIASAISAIVNIVLNIICIHKFGYMAAGYTTMFSYGLMLAMHWFFIKKISQKYKDIDYMFNYKVIALSSLMILIFVLFSLWLYQYIVIRYIFILVIFMLLIYNRERFILKFRDLKNN